MGRRFCNKLGILLNANVILMTLSSCKIVKLLPLTTNNISTRKGDDSKGESDIKVTVKILINH
jgi:hypothetical protein